MSVIIPDWVLQASRMTEAEMKQEISVMLFAMHRLTLAQAARFAEMDRIAFQHLIASRGLYVHYDEEDFEKDLATIRALPSQAE
jgi:predicted HTH domain antitoxin